MFEIIVIALLIIAIAGIFINKKSVMLPAKSSGSISKERAVILDSCALIDGRVVELAKVGFITKKVIVPEFIVKELQLLADGRDSYKRERARFGLQVVQQLQGTPNVVVTIDRENPDVVATDDKLVKLAKIRQADLFTTDYNLNQVATIEGVTVLNVNELAHALRPVALPGESVHVTILQSGTNRDQGVGYLDDGTMVVVDGAIKDIGKSIEVSISKSHQTVAGKMLFAQKVEVKPVVKTSQPIPQQKQRKQPPVYRKRNANQQRDR